MKIFPNSVSIYLQKSCGQNSTSKYFCQDILSSYLIEVLRAEDYIKVNFLKFWSTIIYKMKKLLLLLFVLGGTSLFAQTPGAKWVNILDIEDQKVFVDTSTIKQFQNQISVLSITYFKTPQMVESLNKQASSVKSQILFNLSLQKYSTVGTLYYDDKLKILGESSLPGLSGSGETYAIPIDSNQVAANIYDYCLKFINRGEKTISEKDFSKQGDRTRTIIDKQIGKDTLPKPSDNNSESKKEEKPIQKTEIIKDEPVIKTPVTKPVEKDTSVKVVDQSIKKKEEAIKALASKRNESRQNISETNPKSTIFSDGNKYSFQVSSWKNKAKAESEAAKLKALGHNAFISEAYVSERKGTWYRVRIGYFNSIEETETYQKKLK
jgi:cell division septation protein DedD